MNEDLKCTLLLKKIYGLGNSKIKKILLSPKFNSGDFLSMQTNDIVYDFPFLKVKEVEALGDIRLKKCILDIIEREIHQASKQNIKIINILQKDYPEELKKINDPPVVLYVNGTLNNLDSIACVGTRKPDEKASDLAKQLVDFLSDFNINITAGLALGVDTLVHTQAIKRGLPTYAVVANGLDIVYPKENKTLHEQIISSGGAIISEYSLGTNLTKYNLVNRDRIQSGISKNVFVVQTEVNGGTMHTARSGMKQGKKVFAALGSGSEKLISEGATKIKNYEEFHNILDSCEEQISLYEIARL